MKVSIKVCLFTLFFILLFTSSSYGFTRDEIVKLQKEYFKDDNSIGVKDVGINNKSFYLIRSSLSNLFSDPKTKMQRKLSLLNKGNLLKHLQINHKNGKQLKGIKLQNLFNSVYTETNNRAYLVSYINKENVLLNFRSDTPADNSDANKSQDLGNNGEVIESGDFDSSAQKEIDSLKKYLKQNPNSIEGHQDLYQFYKVQNDFENMSTTMDKIMDLKFMQSE